MRPRETTLVQGETRSPALAVIVNGVPAAGALSAEVVSVSHLAADRFRARLSLTASGPATWAQPSLQAEIQIGLDGAWTSLITGNVDRVSIDPINGLVDIDGRDLSASLLQARTRETFENRTSSEVATLLASRHGLTAAVAPTSTLIGRYYQDDHTRTTLDQYARASTEWDLLIGLAAVEGFDVWVSGQTLNFVPAVPGSAKVISPQDCIALELERALDIENGIEVVVKSWNTRSQMLVQESAQGGMSGAAPVTTIIVRPNLGVSDAANLAKRTLAQILGHSRTITAEMPGDLTTMPRDSFSLTGTGTDFDAEYVVVEVGRRFSFHHGYTQTVEARLPAWTVS